jgi:hypothetical protein
MTPEHPMHEDQPSAGRPDSSERATKKRPYAAPVLRVFGDLAVLTRHISTGANMDGGAGGMSHS